ncbi:MAG: hypothetical protein ACI88L_000233 [Candidatus Paceibacteria bacterium]|jgi:hypothetical protein
MIKRNYSWVNIFAFLFVIVTVYYWPRDYLSREKTYVVFAIFTTFVFFWGWICGRKSGHGKPIKFDDLKENSSFTVVKSIESNIFGGARYLCRLENDLYVQIDFMFGIKEPPFIRIEPGNCYKKKLDISEGVLVYRFFEKYYLEFIPDS